MNTKIRLLLTLDGFRIAAFGLLGPIYAIFVQKIGGDILDAGLAFAVYSITLGVIAYFVGRLGDRIKNQINLMVIGHILLSIGFFSYLVIKNPVQFMFAQFILGAGAAISDPIYDALFSANLDKGKQYSEWADWESLDFILTGVAAIIGSSIAEFFGFRILFIIMGLSSLISLFFVYLFKIKNKRV